MPAAQQDHRDGRKPRRKSPIKTAASASISVFNAACFFARSSARCAPARVSRLYFPEDVNGLGEGSLILQRVWLFASPQPRPMTIGLTCMNSPAICVRPVTWARSSSSKPCAPASVSTCA